MFSALALHRLRVASFGRRQPFTFAVEPRRAALLPIEEVRLFLTTFVGGLLFMTIYLA